MVGRVLLAAALVWVAGLLVACAGGPAALTLGSAPWQDGEVARYDILDREGNRVGGATFSVGRDGDSWLLSEDDAVGAVKQSSRVRLDGTTLRPQSGQKEIHAPGTEATVRYTYAGENLEIKAVVNGEDRAATVNVPENTLDNDQFLMTLRAIPFAEGYAGSTLVVVPASATRVSAIVRVLGKETLELPAGTFEAWRVELDFGQAKQHAWYQVEAPHRMLQYDNGAQRFVLLAG